MLKAKVTTIGNSTGITLPKEVLGKLKVSKGDYLYLIETPNGYEVTAYNQQFVRQMEAAQKIMRRDRNVLKALAAIPDKKTVVPLKKLTTTVTHGKLQDADANPADYKKVLPSKKVRPKAKKP